MSLRALVQRVDRLPSTASPGVPEEAIAGRPSARFVTATAADVVPLPAGLEADRFPAASAALIVNA